MTADLFTQEGVLVQQEGDIRAISGLWTVVVVIHPPPKPDFNLWINQIVQDILTLKTKGQAGDDDFKVWMEHISFLQGNIRANGIYKTVHSPRNRRERRALFGFVSTISNYLFGTATQNQINVLTNAIKDSQHKIETLSHQGAHMISVMNQTRLYLHENRMDIAVLQNASIALAKRVETNTKRVDGLAKTINTLHIRRSVDIIIAKLERSVNLYLHQLTLFHKQRQELERGYLTDEIMPVAYLEDVLQQLTKRKHEVAPLRWHYQHLPIVPLHDTPSELSFRTIIPGLSETRYLQFKLRYFPIPLGKGYLRQVEGENNIALDTVSSATFVPGVCVGSTPRICSAAAEYLTPSCESNLLTGRQPEGCHTGVTPRGNATSAIHRDNGRVSGVILVAYMPTETTLRCLDKRPIVHTYSGPTHLTVGPGCVLQSKDWQIRGIDSGYSDIELPPPTYVNLPGFNLTFPDQIEETLNSELKFTRRMDIPLLDLKNFDNYKSEFFSSWPPLHIGSAIGAPTLLLLFIIMAIVCIKCGCCKACLAFKKPNQPTREPILPCYTPTATEQARHLPPSIDYNAMLPNVNSLVPSVHIPGTSTKLPALLNTPPVVRRNRAPSPLPARKAIMPPPLSLVPTSPSAPRSNVSESLNLNSPHPLPADTLAIAPNALTAYYPYRTLTSALYAPQGFTAGLD